MTLTVRSASVTGATTAARALTHAEMDANWAHVIESSNHNFTQSGSGALAETVNAALRRIVHTAQYSTQGNYETARDALTGTFGMANLDVRGQVALTGSSASLVIDNESDTDFLDAIVLRAGSTAIAKRYLDFRNLNDTTEWRMGANATAGFIVFNNADQRHPFWAAAASVGGNTLISAGTGGTVKINAEDNVCSNAGLAVHAGGSGTPARWVTLDGNGVRIFTGGLQFGAAGGSQDLSLVRDAADVLALRSLASPTTGQTFRVYGTYTSASVYHRLAIKQASTLLSNVSGATVTATNLIPDGAFLIGVTTRIDTTLGATSGTTGYTVGDGSDVDLWGVISAITAGTASSSSSFTAVGACGLYTSATSVVLTASGGNFDGTGVIRVIAHYITTEAD